MELAPAMPWWDAYFGELYLRMFAVILTPDRTAQEMAGVMTMLDLRPGARILDLCCGQGRHSVPLARAGYRVTGLDRSPYLLRKAQERAGTNSLDLHWVVGDMRRLPWRGCFDACLNLFTSFGYFEDDSENLEVLKQICQTLKPGGQLLLDVSNRDYDLLHLFPSTWQRVGQALILEETHYEPSSCRFTSTFTWVEGKEQESLTHSVRHYTAPELRDMLQRAGLLPAATYGGFDGSNLDLDSKRLIIVAHKP
jgi:SAM-dependent methyltransferase